MFPPPNFEASLSINETLRRMRSFNPEPPRRPRHWEQYEQLIDTNGNQGAITPFPHYEIGDPSANAYPRSAWRVFLSRWGIEDPGPLFILFACYSGGLFRGLLTRYLPKFWLSPNRYKMYTSVMTHVGIGMFMVTSSLTTCKSYGPLTCILLSLQSSATGDIFSNRYGFNQNPLMKSSRPIEKTLSRRPVASTTYAATAEKC